MKATILIIAALCAAVPAAGRNHSSQSATKDFVRMGTRDDFIVRFIRQLRTPEMLSLALYPDSAQRLADHLDRRIAHPQNDGFDIVRSGDDEADRAALATWLYNAAHAGPYLAPSWGRNFSEALTWLLRSNYNVDGKAVMVASLATLDPKVAAMVKEKGIAAAYEELKQRR